MLTTAVIVLLALAALGGGVVLVRLLRTELGSFRSDSAAQLSERNADVDRRLQALVETMDRRLGELDTKVDRRLESASKTSEAIHERLARVDESTAQVLEQAKAFGKLEQALRPPKARGGFGELLLANLLRDRLPADAYELQYGFRGGERVDAIIKVERLIPVDAKFPLDNWERMVEAEDDDARTLFEKAFARDLKTHVDAIAAKYIRPDENTYDFALMYLPAEGVYYELVCGKTGSLLSYAHDKRVFPVSPTTLYAQLQVIALGLKGLQIEQHAHEVMAYVAQLQKDFGRFKEDFDLVGTHLGRAQTKFGEAERRLDRLEGKLERASEHEAVDAPAEPRLELDAA
ncbi:MAG TPA: DNA recombination protein RmuC [Gaiellaceae bacterium]|nr:DNA recombination protein RmuC [Gaiellaceae bacterium]